MDVQYAEDRIIVGLKPQPGVAPQSSSSNLSLRVVHLGKGKNVAAALKEYKSRSGEGRGQDRCGSRNDICEVQGENFV